jgi:uncharacterized protein (DUF305 family)
MRTFITLSALLIAAPIAAQTLPATAPASPATQHGHAATPRTAASPAAAMPGMAHDKMEGMDHAKMGGMGEMMKNTPANPYAEVGMAMHHNMMVVGVDASETWTRQMIEHHRGAIAMSKIAVVQARDKDVRTMAERDIAMQEKDVANLQSWLKRNGKSAQ